MEELIILVILIIFIFIIPIYIYKTKNEQIIRIINLRESELMIYSC
jgi:hypothetical protein